MLEGAHWCFGGWEKLKEDWFDKLCFFVLRYNFWESDGHPAFVLF